MTHSKYQLCTFLLFYMFWKTHGAYYTKPYPQDLPDLPGLKWPFPPKKTTPYKPVYVKTTTQRGSKYTKPRPTVPPDVKKGGSRGGLNRGTQWSIEFNIYTWVDVKPATSKVVWHKVTTTPAPVYASYFYTTSSWSISVNAWLQTSSDFDDQTSDSGAYRGSMRSVGGGTDASDNSIIIFIVLASLGAAAIGGVVYWKHKKSKELDGAEGEGADEDAKEEPKEEGDEGEEKPAEPAEEAAA